MLENFRDILSIFVEMLGVEFKVSTDILGDIKELESIISNLLNQGKQADKMIHPQITPLMLYAAFNITDERFSDLINDLIPQHDMLPFPNTTGISALTLAAGNGCVDTLSALIATEQFTQEHIEEAAFFAATMGQAEVITLLHQLNYNVLKPCLFEGITALHIACIGGHSNVVEAILATNPEEGQLNLTTFMDGSTAYDLAVTHNQAECATLLKHTKSAIYQELIAATQENNVERLESLLSENNLPYLFIYRGASLIGALAATAVLDNNYNPLFNHILNHLSKFPVEEQINTLLISLSSFISEFAGKLPENSTPFQQMLKKLKALQPYYKEMNVLMLNGLSLDESIWEIFKEIVQTNIASMKSIHLISMHGSFYDELTQDVCTLSLTPHCLVELVPLLLTNTHITEINVFTDTRHQPLVQILDLIIERNQLIENSSLPLVQDKIYNVYVPKINAILREIKHDATIEGTDKYQELEKKQHVYTLKQLSAFFIQNSMSQHSHLSCPQEVEEYIAQTALPKLPQ